MHHSAIMKYLKLHKLSYLYCLITLVHGSFKCIQQKVTFAAEDNPNKLENNRKLHDLVTYNAANMAVNATEQASCMLNENNIHDLMRVTTDASAFIK